MSPHAIPLETNGHRSSLDLNKFAVSKNAFLPGDAPSQRLSNPHYESWEYLAQNLSSLIPDGIREAVHELDVLSTEYLTSEAEWRRAYVILGFLAHSYVWGGEKPEEILPPQITVPLLQVSEHLEVLPVLTYAACNLWNFSSSNPDSDFSDIDGLKTLVSFTGTESEAWFLLISVAIEAKAAGIVQIMMEALDAVKTRDYDVITESLVALRRCIESVGVLLERMYEKCDPMVFYHKIRPFLAGSKNMEAAGLPRGVFYDEGDGNGQWRQLRGGSNGQSSLIQFFDVILGVEHHNYGKTKPVIGQRPFHEEARDYMPGPHARFLVQIARMGSIRELALVTPTTDEQQRLREAYTAATDALSQFRNKHIQIVTRYIILPSRQAAKGTTQNLASSSSEKRGEGLMGTGGTELVPFLKQTRDETSAAGRLEKRASSREVGGMV